MRCVRRALIAIGLLVVLVTALPLTGWWARALAGQWNDPRGDVLIVLGGDGLGDGTLGLHSYWRAEYAARVWREGGFRQIVVSGAKVGEAMKRFLACEGVPEGAIRVEDRSTSTRENALFVAKMLEGTPGRLVLLTSDYHMARASRAFRKAGLAIAPRPIPDVLKRTSSWLGRWPAFLDLTEETGKTGYYFIRGWL
ncbi:MAG: YdcF family protein [Bryobacteraceae bacterium]